VHNCVRKEDLSFCVHVFNLRSYHLRMTLGPALLCIHITHHRDIEKTSGQPPSSIFEQCDPWTEPQLNLR
jgi:hypothetical protein